MAKKPTERHQATQKQRYPDEVNAMIDNADRCLNCGAKLRYSLYRPARQNRAYCSLSCYQQKPPLLAWLERKHDKPGKELLLETLNQKGSLDATAIELGITRRTLDNYVKKYKIKSRIIWE